MHTSDLVGAVFDSGADSCTAEPLVHRSFVIHPQGMKV